MYVAELALYMIMVCAVAQLLLQMLLHELTKQELNLLLIANMLRMYTGGPEIVLWV